MVHLDESVADLPGIRLPHPIQGLGGGGGIRLAGSVTGIEYGWYPRSVGLDEAGDGAGIDDLMADMASEKAVPLETVDYPVLLLDRCEVRLVTDSLAVEKVWPARIHVYPGESNPVTVVVCSSRQSTRPALRRAKLASTR